MVIGWHELDEPQEEAINFVGLNIVRFDDRVQVRAIPAEGKSRRTPKRGHDRGERLERSRQGAQHDGGDHEARGQAQGIRQDGEVQSQVDSVEIPKLTKDDVEGHRSPCESEGRSWADMDDDEWDATSWTTRGHGSQERGDDTGDIGGRVNATEGVDERPLCSIGYSRDFEHRSTCRPCGRTVRRTFCSAKVQCKGMGQGKISECQFCICFDSARIGVSRCVCLVHVGKHADEPHLSSVHDVCTSPFRVGRDSPQTSLSAGHLEAGQSVRHLRRRSNSLVCIMSCIDEDASPSMRSRRRRSVGCGSYRQRSHTCACTYTGIDMCERMDANVQSCVFHSSSVSRHDMRVSALMSAQARFQ